MSLKVGDVLYIAGKMTGEPQFGFPKFDAAAAELRAMGYEVISPAELDDPATRKLCLASPDGDPGSTHETWGELLARDIRLVADVVSAIVVLPGWTKSRGARLETFVAFLCGKPVYHFGSLQRVAKRTLVKAWLGELYG